VHSCILQLWTSPPVEVVSNAVTCPVALNLASLPRQALALQRVPRSRISPHCRGGFWHCHISYISGPLLPAKEGSDVVVCLMALDPASLLGWAPALPRGPQLFVGRGPQI
jgi:hypothetical protein